MVLICFASLYVNPETIGRGKANQLFVLSSGKDDKVGPHVPVENPVLPKGTSCWQTDGNLQEINQFSTNEGQPGANRRVSMSSTIIYSGSYVDRSTVDGLLGPRKRRNSLHRELPIFATSFFGRFKNTVG